jgi:hypothetical protein
MHSIDCVLFARPRDNFLAGQDIRQFETGIQEFRRKDRFIGGFRRLGALIRVGWPFQMEGRGGEMIFGVHKMMTYWFKDVSKRNEILARGSE